MAAANERIPVLVTGKEKSEITRRAKNSGLSVGEYLRRAAKAYRPAMEDEKAIEGMLRQMVIATERAEKAIDDVVAFVKASNRRIAAMEASKGAR